MQITVLLMVIDIVDKCNTVHKKLFYDSLTSTVKIVLFIECNQFFLWRLPVCYGFWKSSLSDSKNTFDCVVDDANTSGLQVPALRCLF